jgi:hypothetical protein
MTICDFPTARCTPKARKGRPSVQEPVQRRVPGENRSLKGGERHGDPLARHIAVTKDLLEFLDVFRHGPDLLFHEIQVLVHLERGHHGEECLVLERR